MTKPVNAPYKRLTRTCPLCQEPFHPSSSRQKYCDDCRTQACVVCGKRFKTSPLDHFPGRTTRRTCSTECASKLRERTELVCEYCGKPFYPIGGHLDQMYCSVECKGKASRKYPDGNGPTRNSWEYKRWRRQVFKRDDYICQDCGATTNLHAHHLKEMGEYPHLAYEPSNGITLCQDCHVKRHNGKPILRKGTDRIACANCGAAITGRGESPYCRSCATKLSPKAQAASHRRRKPQVFCRDCGKPITGYGKTGLCSSCCKLLKNRAAP